MTMLFRLFQRALKEKGQHEIKGAQHNARIVAYHSATSLGASDDETPWCASFVNWVLQQEGHTGTNSAAARSFVNWGVDAELDHGAIVVLKRGTQAWQGHVGFLYDHDDTRVWLLGGNQGDSVSIAEYRRSDVIAVRKPKGITDSKTVKVATVGGAAGITGLALAAQQMLTEAEAALNGLVGQYDWVNPALSVVTVLSLGFVIYDRIRRMKLNGQ